MDLRQCLNAISDVIVNRPRPLREFDQIYMKAADMLIQAEHVNKWLAGRDVVFIGDGDALALSLMHLHLQEHLPSGPLSVHVLDFDERIVNSVARFAERYGYAAHIHATLYNVADPLPCSLDGRFAAFYTNPPFGGSNSGQSVKAFLRRGIEACGSGAVCCAVLADYPDLPWCKEVLVLAQRFLLENGFHLAEMVPRFHTYHLDDEPELTSCSLIALHAGQRTACRSKRIPQDEIDNFYGKGASLRIRYVRDLTNGGKLASRDHECEPYEAPIASKESE